MSHNFYRVQLQGKSFKNQNLTGANFSYADIRGVDFSKAILIGANFDHAEAGLQRCWVISLAIVALLLSTMSGFVYTYAGFTIAHLGILSRMVILLTLIAFSVVAIYQGLRAAIGIIAVISSILMLFTVAISSENLEVLIVELVFGTLSMAGAIAGAIVFAEAVVMTKVITVTPTTVLAVVMALFGSVLGVLPTGFDKEEFIVTAPLASFIALFMVALGTYLGEKAFAEDEKYSLLKKIAVNLCAKKSTSFCGANLTDADFTFATLKSTDFRDALLTRTCFYQAKMLNRVCAEKTYLQEAQVRHVLVTGQGQDKNFDRQDLRGVNFKGANLVDASFIGADLSQANLQEADLSRAKLVQAQLNETDFTGATLTGAYIQDWGITTDTKFDGVRCEYVYMRLPTKENPDPLRKPDNHKEVFADGEFGDFIQPIFDTLDLYHNQEVDPRAIAISFKQLAENHPDAELEIVAMEKRGQDKFLLRAKTAIAADKSYLSAEYFDTYNEIKGLPEREIKLLLEEKDSRIRSLENFVNQALQRPSFYSNVEQVGTMTNNPGGFSIDGLVGGNVNNVQGEGNRVFQGDTTMSGDRNINTGGGNYNERIERDYIQGNYYAAGVPQSLAEAAAEIQLLLKQLEQTYPTTTTSQQMVVAAEAINRIESNPTLKKRVINAVKEGGLAAFEKAIDNPAGAFIVGAIKGWQEVEFRTAN
ncbi:pentapeptide repeat-containing protein [Nostoc favosum]|uniref:Pentapeptide repeat-containing protein n=1 Tax=Nostoc favosum CHAB5714 TaxID=2780399 RepID=A0ABS8ICQ8_9NOSO|nr:pentapeptide repeat-containing protein [Nostoc favosum]MCC5601297.1 pentapeptide repeat-containing protein [Nostoc favosum CHAB5714]